MDGVKKYSDSLTIQGAVINMLVFIDLLFKLQIGSEAINSLIVGVFGVIGIVMVIYGRLRARKVLIK
ncbi:hypothetical protein D4R42_00390 [bacterium]|nr:MAG: hypothetical protein D4R42_00390 [bacterium]